MFQHLKTGVDILDRALNLRSELIQRKRKRKLLLDLLTFYFCISRIVENGRELLSVAGEVPLQKILALPPEERLKFSSKVYALLLTQRLLLGKLSDLLFAQPIMEVFDPSLKDELQALIGSKDRGLLSVGAALHFYFIFKDRPSLNEVAEYGEEMAKFRYQAGIVCMIFSETSEEIIDVDAATKNIDELAEAGERLRGKINDLFPYGEQLEFVEKAKKVADSI